MAKKTVIQQKVSTGPDNMRWSWEDVEELVAGVETRVVEVEETMLLPESAEEKLAKVCTNCRENIECSECAFDSLENFKLYMEQQND